MSSKRGAFLFVLLTALVLGFSLTAAAQDEDPSDNACYAGGVWQGQCQWPTDAENEWAWNCGWYLARALDGRIAWSDYPETCGGGVQPICATNIPLSMELCLDSAGNLVSVTAPVYRIWGALGEFENSTAGFIRCDDSIRASNTAFVFLQRASVELLFPLFAGDNRGICLYVISW